MDIHFGVLIITMIGMGVLGGIINYYINNSPKKKYEENTREEIIKSVIIGIGASFLVPLFLNMISSNLLPETNDNYNKTLVFAGFCLIAAITSKTFINSMTERVLKQAEEASEAAKKAEKSVQVMKKNIDPILAKETEQEESEEKITDEQINVGEDDTDEIKIMKALVYGRYIYRSLSGISKCTKVTKERINEKLNELIAKGLVAQIVRESELRYYITEKGRKEVFTCDNFLGK
ncbi:MAG: YEATS-associated helix-containing protein [Bacillota bacterium]